MNINIIRRDNLRFQLSLLKKRGISAEKFALDIGSSKSSLSQVIGKKPIRNIGNDMARRVEENLGLQDGWLDLVHSEVAYEGEIISNVRPTPNIPEIKASYPLISSVQAGAFAEIVYTELVQTARMIPCHKKAVGNAFWLTVDGDSMTAPVGVTPSFPKGVRILVDTGVMPENGQFCVAACDGGSQATFKRFSIDDGTAYLKPLNPAFPMIPANNCRIIGKVIAAQWEF